MKKTFSVILLLCFILLYGCGAAPEDTTDVQTENVTKDITGQKTDTETMTETDAETEQVIQDDEMKRYFIFRIWNFKIRGISEFQSIVDTAANTGFNAIKVHMPWHLIQSADGTSDYSAFDEMLDYVINVKDLPVAVSIDFARRYGDGMLDDDELQRLLDTLRAYPEMRIELRGHTDNQGTADFNMKLSEARAAAVAEYLIGKGIEPQRLTTKGFGKTMPVESNDTPEGRSRNRRVEYRVLAD